MRRRAHHQLDERLPRLADCKPPQPAILNGGWLASSLCAAVVLTLRTRRRRFSRPRTCVRRGSRLRLSIAYLLLLLLLLLRAGRRAVDPGIIIWKPNQPPPTRVPLLPLRSSGSSSSSGRVLEGEEAPTEAEEVGLEVVVRNLAHGRGRGVSSWPQNRPTVASP
ncbi:hypothetical protein F4820DRAFT_404494 [Hypoxylon rubiginosum]|uniref:Uncharacterized protein n=1 Tax=Hypoxylon rubiginosum TaxID=110542 RepID=A0ACB9ZEU8_9PEZI|nr:hypothetical protein F4820DRAFT_404494 [Hypoxylon rubiginosum]